MPQSKPTRLAIFAVLLVLASSASFAHATDWDIHRFDNRDYVSLRNIKDFYRFKEMSVSKGIVTLKSTRLVLKARAGSADLIINNIKFILSYPAREAKGKVLISRIDLCKLVDPVLRPTYIKTAKPFTTVIIDPGHGGHDSGAKGVYGFEKIYALDISRKLAQALQRKGFRVKMTRATDKFVSLGGRVAMANQYPDAIFISIHLNHGKSAARGVETYALAPRGTKATFKNARAGDYRNLSGNRYDSENIALATAVHASLLYHLKAEDRGVKRDRWFVLRGINIPSILVECGFITNRSEGAKINSPTYRQSIADSIAAAVVNYRKAITSGR